MDYRIVLQLPIIDQLTCLVATGILNKNKSLMEMSKLEEGRKDKKAHFWLLDELAVTIAGVEKHKNKSIQEVEKWLTPSSEAFARLCYENYCKSVEAKHKKDENVTPTKYTQEGRGAKRNQGWNIEGIRRFNELYQSVTKDREAHGMVDLECFNQKKMEKENSTKSIKRAKQGSART